MGRLLNNGLYKTQPDAPLAAKHMTVKIPNLNGLRFRVVGFLLPFAEEDIANDFGWQTMRYLGMRIYNFLRSVARGPTRKSGHFLKPPCG